jgi:SAM-dependent methyltransferase
MTYALDDYFRLLRRVGSTRGEDMARSFFDNLFGGIDFRGRRVLDIGGGDGMYSFYAALSGAAEVVCLEPGTEGAEGWTAGAVETMLAALPQLPVRRLNQTLQAYRDPDGFDILISIASINHLDEEACARLQEDPRAEDSYRQVFRHVARLARPGARFVIVDCARHNFFAMLGLKNPLCPTIEWHKHQPPQVWAKLLREAGFGGEVVRWEPLYRFGRAGRWLLSNRLAAFFTKSAFRLEMAKPV